MTGTGSCSSGRLAANETGSHVRDAQLVSLVVLEMDHGRRRWNVKLRSVDEKRQSHRAAVERAAGDRGAVLIGAAGQALPDDVDTRAVVLVEGASDQLAVEALAARRGRDLDAEGVSVVSIGGAGNIGRFLQLFGPRVLPSDWRASMTPPRSATSGAVWSGPASAPTSPATTWKHSVSMCASPTWRTS